MQTECLTNVKTGKIMLWFGIHTYGDQRPYHR